MKTLELLNANQALNTILSDDGNRLKAPIMFKLVKFQKDNAGAIAAFQESLKACKEKYGDNAEEFNKEVGELLNTELDIAPIIKMEDIECLTVSGQTMVNLMPLIKE